MTNTTAKEVADLAWSGLMELANIGPHGMPYELRAALKAETSRKPDGGGLPLHLAKARLVESAISGAERPTRNLGELHGIRQAHVTAMMIGARLGLGKVVPLGADGDLEKAAKVLFDAWPGVSL